MYQGRERERERERGERGERRDTQFIVAKEIWIDIVHKYLLSFRSQ